MVYSALLATTVMEVAKGETSTPSPSGRRGGIPAVCRFVALAQLQYPAQGLHRALIAGTGGLAPGGGP